jgi:hypothetical protein
MAKQNEFLVYFVHNEDGHWQTKYFKDGFKHCGVISYDTDTKHWIIIEYIFGQILVETISDKEADAFFRLVRIRNGVVLKGENISERTGFPSFMGSWIKEHSCVSYVQRLIGLNKWWIFSPYQLYCALKKRGYSEIDL